ncbi:GPI inositol-deacylase PGAP1-like [Dillenia turbinata]|uniref:GPI inositol-deacylase n=1 Tax=Dillenia turbinata TaxID=194707 RepID=A0AAN8UHY9_9MAGN
MDSEIFWLITIYFISYLCKHRSHKVRSLASESDRAYQGGPLERTFYQEASLTPDEGGLAIEIAGLSLPNQYASMLDWFAVDLEGEHSAMDGRTLEEHTEYVVYAIHRILDKYKESHDARTREGAAVSANLPRSVILVGHSMGGFVARAAIVHPQLRKSAVETILTLSSPHQSPPVALQPSYGHYVSHVNRLWKKGYEVQASLSGHFLSEPVLSHVVVVSISGGVNDYQVRPMLESLDGIVPPTHGFMISSTSIKNVWLSMEHQVILWCNQLVVQVSHTLLSLIDSKSGQPFTSPRKRLAIFAKMLRSGTPQSFDWVRQSQSVEQKINLPITDEKDAAEESKHKEWGLRTGDICYRDEFGNIGEVMACCLERHFEDKEVRDVLMSCSQVLASSSCPSNARWSDDNLERDLYIETTTVTVLAMDGRRRWLDIQKLGSNGKGYFIFVTNLAPCSGVRLHLWPEKGKSTADVPASRRLVEVTSKMVHIPSGPAPTQIEPGSQTEQAPPSAVLRLSPEEMRGYRYLTISVAPHLTVSGRPPPAASMVVGQFFNPDEGGKDLSSSSMLLSAYSPQEMLLKEDHPLAFKLSFPISLGLLPVTLSLKAANCGIKNAGLPVKEAGDVENSRLCMRRCFPPLALAWDATSGLHIFPNLFSETIVVDSSPALWSSTQGSERTDVMLLVDPHCAYKARISVSVTAAASRFLLLYCSQIVGFSVAVIFCALMRQAHTWEKDLPLPSLLTAVESNLRIPFPFLLVAIGPILAAVVLSLLMYQPVPPITSFVIVSLICFLFANGCIIILILASQLILYVTAVVHVFIKTWSITNTQILPILALAVEPLAWLAKIGGDAQDFMKGSGCNMWEVWEGNVCFICLHWFINLSTCFFSIKAVKILRANPLLVTSLITITLVCFLHPALGLFVLLFSHALFCHNSLCSFLSASFHGHASRKKFDFPNEDINVCELLESKLGGGSKQHFSLDENQSSSPNSTKSFSDTQLEIFHQQHALLILNVLAAFMLVPSFVAWVQRIGIRHSFPWFWDSTLCIGVILHGVCNSKPGFDSLLLPFPGISKVEVRLSCIYLIAGYYSYLSGLALAPYRVFYVMAIAGFMSLISRTIQMRNGERGEANLNSRKHSHRH